MVALNRFRKLQLAFSYLVLACSFICAGFAFAEDDDFSGEGRIALKQTQGEGFGYHQGYTTLEGFLIHTSCDNDFAPFVDVRAHHFNNGQWAANFGIGARKFDYCSNAIWGGNIYYDCRNTKHKKFQQVGLGMEFLHCNFDARLNVYLPVGGIRSHSFDCRTATFCNPELAEFSQNSLRISQTTEIRKKYDTSLLGGNFEVGRNFAFTDDISLYIAAGPYCYSGNHVNTFWGGSVRATAYLTDYLSIEVASTFDKFYHSTCVGQIALSIPFGCEGFALGSSSACGCERNLQRGIAQRVFRNEIIPIKKQTRTSFVQQTVPAVNPSNGQTLNFIFVNNTNPNPGNGSFENPYNSLAAAQLGSGPNDIIYVYQGDGTTKNMDLGITLQENQQFLGTGLTYAFPTQCGPVSVFDPGTPTITNIDGDAVTLADNNVVRGFFIDHPLGIAINGDGINNTLIQDNFIDASTGGTGIQLLDCTGNLDIIDNTVDFNFTGTRTYTYLDIPLGLKFTLDAGVAVSNHGTTSCTTLISGNKVNTNLEGIYVFSFDQSSITSTIRGNTVTGGPLALIGIDIDAFNESTHTTIIDSNNVSDIRESGGVGIVAISSRTAITPPITYCYMESHITNNTVSACQHNGIAVAAGNGGRHSSHVLNNSVTGSGSFGFNIETSNTPGGDVLCLQLLDNASDTGFLLTNSVGVSFTNTFALEPPVGNTGSPITEIGVITSVPADTCQ